MTCCAPCFMYGILSSSYVWYTGTHLGYQNVTTIWRVFLAYMYGNGCSKVKPNALDNILVFHAKLVQNHKYKGCPKKKGETGSDVKKVRIAAVSQAVERVQWSILHYLYKFRVVITCCLQGRTIRMKDVQRHYLKIEIFWDIGAGKETRSMHCGLILFLVKPAVHFSHFASAFRETHHKIQNTRYTLFAWNANFVFY